MVTMSALIRMAKESIDYFRYSGRSRADFTGVKFPLSCPIVSWFQLQGFLNAVRSLAPHTTPNPEEQDAVSSDPYLRDQSGHGRTCREYMALAGIVLEVVRVHKAPRDNRAQHQRRVVFNLTVKKIFLL